MNWHELDGLGKISTVCTILLLLGFVGLVIFVARG